MTMTPESKVKAKVDAIVQKYSDVIVNPLTKGYGKSGVSDKLLCINGCFVALETKTVEAKGAKKIPTKLQFRFLVNVLDAHGYVAVVNETNYTALEKLLSELHSKGTSSTKSIVFDGCPEPRQGAIVREVTL